MHEFFIYLLVLSGSAIFMAHMVGLFIDSDSKYQKWKLRKSLDRIYERLTWSRQDGIKYPEVSFTYKNRNFNVSIHKKDLTSCYCTYTIYINGDEAGCYHKLKHLFLNSYYFEPLNKRDKLEVIKIMHACNKVVKKKNKAIQEKPMSHTEYSYFK